MYPDAETFNPLRWLDPSYPTFREPLTQYPNLNGFSQFGFGRRTCQGIPIVEQDLFLAMGGMAWAFSIRKKRDAVTGREIPVHWNDYTPLLIAKPTPFSFDLFPRSEDKMVWMSGMYETTREREKQEEEETAGYEFAQFPKAAVEKREMEDSDEGRGGGDVESDHDIAISVRGSSPEPGLSYQDSSSEDEELDSVLSESEVEMMADFSSGKQHGWKEPMVTVSDVPGAWRWA